MKQMHCVLQTFDVYEDKKHQASMVVINSTRNGRQKQHQVRKFLCSFFFKLYIFVLYQRILSCYLLVSLNATYAVEEF